MSPTQTSAVTKLKQAKGAKPMNQISKAARPDLRTTENVRSAPAAPSRQYDKDGNPATVAVEFRNTVFAVSVAPEPTRSQAHTMHIPRSDFVDYDDGNPGTVIA